MKFNKLWALCAMNDISPSKLFAQLGLSSQTYNCMRDGKEGYDYKRKKGSVSLRTIDKLCTYFKCQPSDIMELE